MMLRKNSSQSNIMQSCGNHAAGALPSRGAAGWRGPELTACSVKPSRTCDSSWVPYAAFRFQLLVHLARRRARHDLRRAHRFGHILQGNEAGDQPPLCVPPRSGIDLLLGGSLQSDHAVADPGHWRGSHAIFYHFARRPAASGPGLLFKLLRYGYSHTAQSGMELQYHAPQPTSRTCT